MRKLHELYELVLKHRDLSSFICVRIDHIMINEHISIYEKRKLVEHFKSQKPTETLHSEFYNHNSYQKNSEIGSSWWGSASQKQRNLFIKKLIQITKEQNI